MAARRNGDINDGWPGEGEDDHSLADAYARVNEARSDMARLETEVREFVQRTVEMMVRRQSGGRSGFVISLPPAKLAHNGQVSRKIRLLCGAVSENLRAALDYGILQVSRERDVNVIESNVKFVLAPSRQSFDRQSTKALKHVTEEFKNWMEQLQPYNGNQILGFIRDTSNVTKHRSLLKVRHATKLTIVLKEIADGENSLHGNDWCTFPVGEGHAFFARIGNSQLIVREKYDALTVLPICIEHVERILNTLDYYLRNGNFPIEDCEP